MVFYSLPWYVKKDGWTDLLRPQNSVINAMRDFS